MTLPSCPFARTPSGQLVCTTCGAVSTDQVTPLCPRVARVGTAVACAISARPGEGRAA